MRLRVQRERGIAAFELEADGRASQQGLHVVARDKETVVLVTVRVAENSTIGFGLSWVSLSFRP